MVWTLIGSEREKLIVITQLLINREGLVVYNITCTTQERCRMLKHNVSSSYKNRIYFLPVYLSV